MPTVPAKILHSALARFCLDRSNVSFLETLSKTTLGEARPTAGVRPIDVSFGAHGVTADELGWVEDSAGRVHHSTFIRPPNLRSGASIVLPWRCRNNPGQFRLHCFTSSLPSMWLSRYSLSIYLKRDPAVRDVSRGPEHGQKLRIVRVVQPQQDPIACPPFFLKPIITQPTPITF